MGCGYHTPVSLGSARLSKGLIVKIVPAFAHQDVGSGHRSPSWKRLGRTRNGNALLLPGETILAGRMPDLAKVPVRRRNLIGGLAGPTRPDRRHGSAALRVPDMVLTAGQDRPGRVTTRNRAIAFVVFKTFERGVLELRKEFVVLNSRRRVLEHTFHGRAQGKVGPFIRQPVWKNGFLTQAGN